MHNVVEFKRKQETAKPLTFFDRYKALIRKYYTQEDFFLIVASVYDTDCYHEAPEHIQHAVDIYYRFKPKNV